MTEQDRIQGLRIFFKVFLHQRQDAASSGDYNTGLRSKWHLVGQPQTDIAVLHRNLNVTSEQEWRIRWHLLFLFISRHHTPRIVCGAKCPRIAGL